MDIAALSIVLNQNKVQEQAGLSVMKMAMDAAVTQADATTRAMELSVQPNLGANFDGKA